MHLPLPILSIYIYILGVASLNQQAGAQRELVLYMAQQFGQNGYLGLVAKAASSLAEGENRSKTKKDNDLVSRLEGEAVKAIGAKLLSGDGMSTTNNPRNVGHLLNRVSTFHQDKNGGSYLGKNGGSSYANRGMLNDGYDEYSGNSRGGYGYSDTRTGGYGGGSGWNGAPSANRGYGYEGRGYGGDAGWNPSGMSGSSGWDRPGDSVGLGRQEYYGDSNYERYGNRGRMNDGYNGWNDNPPMSRGGYGYA